MLASRYMVAGRDVVSEAFDGDIVVLDLNSGRYFSFSDSGCVLWEALSAGAAPKSLLIPEAVYSADDIEAFLVKLVDHRLLAVNPEPADWTAVPETMARLSAASEKPDVFVFDDLADLFIADPIHDVEEEAGWPMVKPAVAKG